MEILTVNPGELSAESGNTVVDLAQLNRDELMALLNTIVTPTVARSLPTEKNGVRLADGSGSGNGQDLYEDIQVSDGVAGDDEETEEDELSGFKFGLIQEVQKRRNLWDTSDKEYSRKNARKRSWEEVAKALSEPLDRCKEVWGKLSDYYGKQLLKKPRKPTGSAASKRNEPEPVWKYFSDMEFMRPVKNARRTESNVKPKRNVMPLPDAVLPESPASAVLSDADFPESPVSPPITKKKLTRDIPQREATSDDRLESSLSSLAGKLGAQLEKKSARDDGGTILGDLVACAYTKLSIRRRLELRKGIIDLLYEYEMQELDDHTNDY